MSYDVSNKGAINEKERDNRTDDQNVIKIMDCNGKAQLTTHTVCPLLDEFEDRVVESLQAEDVDTYAIWLKEEEKR